MDEGYSFQQVDLLKLDLKDRVPFYPFITNPDKLFSEKLAKEDKLLAFAAFLSEKPIGICYGYAFPTIGQGFIKELNVSKQHCGRGIGFKLLEELTALFKKSNVSVLTWKYHSNQPGVAHLEKILEKQNWEAPQILVERYFFDSATFGPDWYRSKEPFLPKGYQIFPWRSLKRKEENEVKDLIIPHSILEDISPFDRKYPLEPLNSLGLRLNGKIVGWMITNRLDKDTISYASLYIHPEIRGLGPAIALLKESIRLHIEARVKTGVTEINLKRTPKYWQNFVRKRLAPYSYQKELSLLAYKNF